MGGIARYGATRGKQRAIGYSYTLWRDRGGIAPVPLRDPCASDPVKGPTILGHKSCRTKLSRIFRIFGPNFAPNFAPNFPRIF